MKADFLLSPFLEAPKTVLGSLILFSLAVCFGQILFGLSQSQFWDPHDMTEISFYVSEALFQIPITLVMAALSGVGLLFLLIDFVCLYRLLHEETSRVDLFFTIAACQMAMLFSIWIVSSRCNPSEYITYSILAGIVLAFLYWSVKFTKRKIEQSGAANAAARRG
jgi:hypothetical protein